MISNRLKKITPNFIVSGLMKYHSNPYSADENPSGMINVGVSENKLVEKEIMEKLTTINFQDFNVLHTHYPDLSGTKEFRAGLSQYLNSFMNPKDDIHPEDVFVMNGCGTVVETLGSAICDDGEGILLPAPYYATYKDDLDARFNAKLISVKSEQGDSRPFQLTRTKLESSANAAKEQGIKIRGLLISNPINPLGITYTEEELQCCLDFCLEHNIHMICNEIYSFSVYDKKDTFKNILSFQNIAKYKEILHVIWGFSKDFALSGFRCGMVVTFNDKMKRALTAVAYYSSVPTSTQHVLNKFLSDTEWIKRFQAINHKRLREARDLVMSELNKAGITFACPNAGFFLSFNVSPFMLQQTFEEETQIYEEFVENGVFLLPGSIQEFSDPGWFRIILSTDRQSLSIGIGRILQSLQRHIEAKQEH